MPNLHFIEDFELHLTIIEVLGTTPTLHFIKDSKLCLILNKDDL